MRRIRILLVEDDAPSRMLARDLLVHRGWEVVEAPDVETALRHLDAELDLILLDVDVPGGGATRVLAALQERSARRVPVAAVTAHAMTGDRERLLASGFDAYFSKPIDTRSFVRSLEDLLRASGALLQDPGRAD